MDVILARARILGFGILGLGFKDKADSRWRKNICVIHFFLSVGV
jgi:hypothetical protein